MSVRLFVGNLPYDVTEPDLRDFFASVGPLSNVIIPVDRETGKRRGFAFVEFSEQAQADEASRRFNNQPFKGRNISINEARAKESRPTYGSGMRSKYPMQAAGVGGAARSGQKMRHSLESQDFSADPIESSRSARAERRNRNFGANAKPSRKRKSNYGPKTEMGPRKGPIRERIGGRFFGSMEDDAYDDNMELDYMSSMRDSDKEDAI